jgi:cytochrome c-type biogenesis protein CcmF
MTEFGLISIWAGLIFTVASIVAYRATGPESKIGRILYGLAVLCVLSASAIHSTLLITHRFDVGYVYRYSARGLPPGYLFATFWAGQEGSFLLWAFWTALLGVVLCLKSGPVYERRVMPIYGMTLLFILVLLAVRSPFAAYVPSGPMDPIHPLDGIGLNPLLENYWMVIHPPTLFLGFASLAATFAYSIAALVWGDTQHWFRRTWPWALFSFAVLGFGIMLGGYWAYETLGWGGFWGWDPVENGPLVPWLAMAAFLHAAQVQRVRAGLKRTTLFLGFAPYLLALYETFLTRTGILDKFSNHSFSTLGGAANNVILYGMLGAMAVSLALLAWRWQAAKSDVNSWENASSREFALSIAIVLLLSCALVTGLGMSAPLITSIGQRLHLTQNASSVDVSFYNKANFPIAVLLLVGMAIGPCLAWKQSKSDDVSGLQWPYALSVVAAVLFYALSYKVLFVRVGVPSLVMFTACAFSLFASVALLFGKMKGANGLASNLRASGAALAHAGAAFLLLGVVFLVTLTRTQEVKLLQDHPVAVENMNMTVAYSGMTSTLQDPANLLKFSCQTPDGRERYAALMPLAARNVEGMKKMLARPSIFHHWWGDVYFSLKDGPEQVAMSRLYRATLIKGQPMQVGGYRMRFDGYDVPADIAAMVKQGQMPSVFPVTAHVSVTGPDGKVTLASPQFIQRMNDPVSPPSPEVKLAETSEGKPWVIAFTDMDADRQSASVYVRDASVPPATAFIIEISTRPMIGFVWLGTVLIALGGLLTSWRRVLENRLSPVPELDIDVVVGDGARKARRFTTRRGEPQVARPAQAGKAMHIDA